MLLQSKTQRELTKQGEAKELVGAMGDVEAVGARGAGGTVIDGDVVEAPDVARAVELNK